MIRRTVLLGIVLAAWAAGRAGAATGPGGSGTKPAWSPPAEWIPEHGAASTTFAAAWTGAMVTGNGTMGAMVMGSAGTTPRAQEDRIYFSHSGLFLPVGTREVLPALGDFLGQMRQTIRTRGYSPALTSALAGAKEQGFPGLMYADPFLPALEFDVKLPAAGPVRNYLRTEDFATGEVTVRWTDDAGSYVRKLFISRAENVAVMWIGPAAGAEGPGGPEGPGGAAAPETRISCELWIPPIPGVPVRTYQLNNPTAAPAQGAARALIRSAADVNAQGITLHYEYREGGGAGYDAAVQVIVEGGTARAAEDRIAVQDARGVLVLLRIEPFAQTTSYSDERLRRSLEEITPSYAELLAAHRRIHEELFHRVALDLGGGAERRQTTETLLARANRGPANLPPALLEKLYDAARYELLCAAGARPPNLQGVWAATWAPTATQTGDYAFHGPFQLAVASALSCRTPELMAGVFHLADENLADWRKNARNLFGAGGVLVPPRQSSTGKSLEWSDRQPMGLCWTAGGAILAHWYWEQYLYTGDRRFLAEKAVPFMKQVAAFYEDFLFVDTTGKYRFSPSYSTDNAAGDNSTVDIMAATELLTNLIAACRELKIEPEGVARWRKMLEQMPEYLVAPNGELQEWALPGVMNKPMQRHIPHLYAVYPGRQFDPETTPELWKAARAAFETRFNQWFRPSANPGDMNAQPIHDRLLMGLCAARFGDGAEVGEVLARIAARNTYPSLMTQRYEDGRTFVADAGGALPEIVNAALLDSRPGRLDLLPALPPGLPAGEIRGLAARSAPGDGGGGRIEVRSLKWSPETVDVALVSTIDQKVEVRAPRGAAGAQKRLVALKANEVAVVHFALR
jgi:alpha-L-fucosidase 2